MNVKMWHRVSAAWETGRSRVLCDRTIYTEHKLKTHGTAVRPVDIKATKGDFDENGMLIMG